MGRSLELGCKEEAPRRPLTRTKGQVSGKGPSAPAYRTATRAPAVWGPRDAAGEGKVCMEGKSSCLSLQPGGLGGGRYTGKTGCSSFPGPLPQAFSDRPLSLRQAVVFAWTVPPPSLISLSSKSRPSGPSSGKPSRLLWAQTPFCRTRVSPKMPGRGWRCLSAAPPSAAATRSRGPRS